MSRHISVFIEISQFSNQKLEYDLQKNKLILDRVLSYPYSYPFPYGFIPNTLGEDGDELDVLLIGGNVNHLTPGSFCQAHIVGALLMEDEKGKDEKILAVSFECSKNGHIKLEDIDTKDLEHVSWFFTHYKSDPRDASRWSRVFEVVGRDAAIDLYRAAIQRALDLVVPSGDSNV
jgi:inorganic pyrophosphatase